MTSVTTTYSNPGWTSPVPDLRTSTNVLRSCSIIRNQSTGRLLCPRRVQSRKSRISFRAAWAHRHTVQKILGRSKSLVMYMITCQLLAGYIWHSLRYCTKFRLTSKALVKQGGGDWPGEFAKKIKLWKSQIFMLSFAFSCHTYLESL